MGTGNAGQVTGPLLSMTMDVMLTIRRQIIDYTAANRYLELTLIEDRKKKKKKKKKKTRRILRCFTFWFVFFCFV